MGTFKGKTSRKILDPMIYEYINTLRDVIVVHKHITTITDAMHVNKITLFLAAPVISDSYQKISLFSIKSVLFKCIKNLINV